MSMLQILLSCLLASLVSAVYIDLNEAGTWCFLEEVPKDTLILAKWKTTPSDKIHPESAAQIGIVLSITDPEQFSFFERTFALTSRFAFTSARGGEYRLCFGTNTTTWFGTGQALKFEIDITHGSEATDYEDLAKTEHLTEVEVSIRKLNDRVRLIRAEQDYQRRREHTFRDTSETTNARVLWWSVAQVSILVVTAAWQMRYLRGFFTAKKLV
mmetsp:Transcript_10222/g.17177  ORF Transcript_10222/g.17177 Transcript_10222/m.17177 type:complete len:213 (-) Transcript_10222:87-725(-)